MGLKNLSKKIPGFKENTRYVRFKNVHKKIRKLQKYLLRYLFPMHSFSTTWKCFQGVEKEYIGKKWDKIAKEEIFTCYIWFYFQKEHSRGTPIIEIQ